MKPILLIEASPRSVRSLSRQASLQIVDRLRRRAPGLGVMARDLAAESLAPVDEAFAEAMHVPAKQQSEVQRRALAQSEGLIAELEGAGTLLIGTPMHNFTVPAVLKAWIDQVLRFERTFTRTPEGKRGLLADRPTYVVVATGGFITGERARQPDFLTPYLTAVLATLGIRTVEFLHLEPVARASDRESETRALVQSWLDTRLPLPADPRSALRARGS